MSNRMSENNISVCQYVSKSISTFSIGIKMKVVQNVIRRKLCESEGDRVRKPLRTAKEPALVLDSRGDGYLPPRSIMKGFMSCGTVTVTKTYPILSNQISIVCFRSQKLHSTQHYSFNLDTRDYSRDILSKLNGNSYYTTTGPCRFSGIN